MVTANGYSAVTIRFALTRDDWHNIVYSSAIVYASKTHGQDNNTPMFVVMSLENTWPQNERRAL